MTSLAHSEPTQLAEGDTAGIARQFITALRYLPSWGRDEVLRRLMMVIAQHERTDDPSVVEHFLESLVMTARMERDPAYLMAEAERESPGEPRDIAEVIAGIETGRRDEPGA